MLGKQGHKNTEYVIHIVFAGQQWLHEHASVLRYTYIACLTGRFIMFSVITNIYNTKTKGPTVMEFFTATGKPIFFYN